MLFLPRLSKRPVPSETTHSKGVLGHKHLHSWIASAVGLLISRPPSCAQNRWFTMLETPFTSLECVFMPRPQSVKLISWHLKLPKRSWISTVNRWNFWRTIVETKRKDQCAVTELLVSSWFVFPFTSSLTVSVRLALISNNRPGVLLLWIHSLPKAMGE